MGFWWGNVGGVGVSVDIVRVFLMGDMFGEVWGIVGVVVIYSLIIGGGEIWEG